MRIDDVPDAPDFSGEDVQDVLEEFFKKAAQYDLLAPAEEVALAVQAHAGNVEAQQRLVLHNLRFAISYAKNYQNRGVSLVDLIQEANVGLTIASRKFDPQKGVKFISYAVWWIRQRILSAIAHTGRDVQLPAATLQRIRIIVAARDRMRGELGRTPSDAEIGAAEGIDPEEVTFCLGLSVQETSLDAPTGDSGSISRLDTWALDGTDAHEPDLDQPKRSNALRDALASLPERWAYVLTLYYGLDEDETEHTFEEIGKMLGVSKQRTKQIHDDALKRLRPQLSTFAPAA